MAAPPGPTPAERRRRRAGAVAGVSVAVLAVAATVTGGWLIAEDAFTGPPDDYRGAPTLAVPTDAVSTAPPPSVSPTGGSPTQGTPSAATPTTASAAAGPPSSAGSTEEARSQSPEPDSGQGEDGSTPPVLRTGDTGSEVVELQKRLREAGGVYYDAPDGVYDDGVRDAVATYQEWRAVEGDPDGVYGAHTRSTLEAETGDV